MEMVMAPRALPERHTAAKAIINMAGIPFFMEIIL